MNHKAILAVFCAVLLCAMAGCQLAREDMGESAYEDRLVGVYVTTEYLDLFDFESYLNDNLNGFSGGQIEVSGDTEKYQGRLYATLTQKTLVDEETGEQWDSWEYAFPDVEGISFFAATVQAGQDSFVTSVSDSAISDGHLSVHKGDDADSMTLEGTIYMSPASKGTYYINPVYQGADGSVYLTAGGGITMTGMDSEGAYMSQTLDSETTITENGKSKTDSISVKLSIGTMFTSEKIVMLEMDAQNNMLSRLEYPPEEMPATVTPKPGTAYLIVETHKRATSGGPVTARGLYDTATGELKTYFTREDGICVAQTTQIMWG